MVCCLIIGGSGFVGEHLSRSMLRKGFKVVVIDFASFINNELNSHKDFQFFKCDITNSEDFNRIFSTIYPTIVVHLASWGMSGADMLSKHCYNVNVLGTQIILDACVSNNVNKIIYTSTYNTVFGGKEIKGKDETMPLHPINQHVDQYSSTKAIAEQIILNANGILLPNKTNLITSCIRPAAIYGVGEKRHYTRIIKHIDGGLFFFKISKATVDWVHIDNLVINKIT
jgi:nucleoside-diphosphate-sugar epimerase